MQSCTHPMPCDKDFKIYPSFCCHAGSKKWQNASKIVSVVLIIAGMGLAFIALVAGNGGSKWSGLVSRLPMLPALPKFPAPDHKYVLAPMHVMVKEHLWNKLSDHYACAPYYEHSDPISLRILKRRAFQGNCCC